MSVSFSVKEKGKVKKEAVLDVKEKAETLCQATNAEIGKAINISYNWGGFYLYSHTSYSTSSEVMMENKLTNYNVEPEEINASDTAIFGWEIIV